MSARPADGETAVNPIQFFRALDDSDLDPFQKSYLLRVWRRGTCWERVESIAATTGMSRAKAYGVRAALLASGWLVEVVAEGRVAYQVAIGNCCISLPDGQKVHQVDKKVHQVDKKVHQVDALPINRQKESSPINHMSAATGEAPLSRPDPELIAAREATFALVEFWEELTKRPPPDDAAAFREKWFKPFNAIWIACGRNLDAAKAKIQAVRNSILAGGGRIFDPAKLPAHVQALVDAELLPMTAALNGSSCRANGYVNYRNDPDAREARNRAVMAEVAREIESGEWAPWTV